MNYNQTREEDNNNNSDNNWESEEDKDIMNVTAVALEELCSKSMVPLLCYNTVKLQDVRRIIVDQLTNFLKKEYGHGHTYLLKLHEIFRLRCNMYNRELPEPPTKSNKALADTNFRKYTERLKIYNKHMKIFHALY